MKIQGPKNPHLEVVSNTRELKPEFKKEMNSKQRDRVDASVSQSLQYLERAIQETDIGLADVHSFVDEKRLENVLISLDRIESKRPRLSDNELIHMAERTASLMESAGVALEHLHHDLPPNRVVELLS